MIVCSLFQFSSFVFENLRQFRDEEEEKEEEDKEEEEEEIEEGKRKITTVHTAWTESFQRKLEISPQISSSWNNNSNKSSTTTPVLPGLPLLEHLHKTWTLPPFPWVSTWQFLSFSLPLRISLFYSISILHLSKIPPSPLYSAILHASSCLHVDILSPSLPLKKTFLCFCFNL